VEAKPRDIQIYATAEGIEPFTQWLRNLRDGVGRGRIRKRIARVRLGNFGKTRAVGEGVIELKDDFGPGYRIYCGQDGDTVVVLLTGGDKDSQATDIEDAKKYWRDYNAQKDD
jgi:putative addiction module killer protein